VPEVPDTGSLHDDVRAFLRALLASRQEASRAVPRELVSAARWAQAGIYLAGDITLETAMRICPLAVL